MVFLRHYLHALHNLPSLSEEERNYTLVQPLTSNPLSPSYKPCGNETSSQEHYAFSVSVSIDSDNAFSETMYYSYTIQTTENEQYDIKKSYVTEYSTVIATNHTHYPMLTCITQAAVYYAVDPAKHRGAIHDFLNAIYVEHISDIETQAAKAMMQQTLLEYDPKVFRRVDAEYVRILSSHGDAMNMYKHINSVHVNVVHDCESVCAQAILSDTRALFSLQNMTLQNMTEYGLLCTRRLLETKDTQCKKCTDCEKHIYSIAISSAVVVGCVTSLFITYSNSKCAKAVRSCCSVIMNALRGTNRVSHYKGSVQGSVQAETTL